MTLLLIVSLFGGTAALAYLAFKAQNFGTDWTPPGKVVVGDPIVYLKYKVSTHPGIRARQIHPSEQGDYYSYLVNKYWTVADVLADGRIVAKTRTNKHHYLRPDDPNLRKARLIERLRYSQRFPV